MSGDKFRQVTGRVELFAEKLTTGRLPESGYFFSLSPATLDNIALVIDWVTLK